MAKKTVTDNILTRVGCKNTKAREAIVEVLENTSTPLSADDIYFKIKELGAAANLSTIYRTLELMENKHLIDKSIMGDGKAKYEITLYGHHHYLICTNCHKSISIDICPIKKLEKEMEKNTNFDITGHRFEVYGICPKCKND